MTFRKLYFLCFSLLFYTSLSGQDPLLFRISEQGRELRLVLNCGTLLVHVSDRGEISLLLNGGAEVKYSDMLGPELGKITQVGDQVLTYYFDTRRAGKLAGIGSLQLDYFDPYLTESKAGKLQSAGNLYLDYYNEMDGAAKNGRISEINGIPVDYYYGGDDAGRVFRVGEIRFYYYPRLSGDVRAGRLSRIEGRDPRVSVQTWLK